MEGDKTMRNRKVMEILNRVLLFGSKKFFKMFQVLTCKILLEIPSPSPFGAAFTTWINAIKM